MSLFLNTNTDALNSHRSLYSADALLSKSIKRLSSGLRINSAADDPSGLAISQRLTTQIKGLERASMNAQDAMSYLQTAESSLSETHEILQRMRELAIQASNGTLTANDRQEIQKEIDQLKEEINRIAESAEFNTKKLLDGTGAALWSTASNNVSCIIRGRVAEGNYELEIETTPVPNHVLKSDIFKVKDAAQGVDNVNLNATNASLSLTFDGITNANAGTLDFDFGNGTIYSLNIPAASSASQVATLINQNSTLNRYLIASVDSSGVNDVLTISSRTAGSEGNSYSITPSQANVAGFGSGSSLNFTGGEDYPSGIVSISNPQNLPETTDSSTGEFVIFADNEVAAGLDTAHVSAVFEQRIGGAITAATTAGSLANHISNIPGDTIAPAGSGYAVLEITNGGTVSGAGSIYGRVSFDNGKTWYNTPNLDAGVNVTLTDGTSQFVITALTPGDIINTGDKILIALNDRDFNGGTHAELQIDAPFANGIGGNAQTGPSYSYPTNSLNNTTTTVTTAYLNTETGDIVFGSVDVRTGFLASANPASVDVRAENNTVSFDVRGAGGPAYSSTKLWQIDKFYNADGTFILGESGKTITIYNAEGSKAEIFIDPDDTIGEVADKIAQAIAKPTSKGGLGMGTGDAVIDSHICDFVTTATPESDETLRGTLVIRSPWMGERGRIFFSAEENILNAFSLATINDPGKDPMTVTVRDAHTGDLIGTETTSDSVVRNIIKGVDVVLNPNLDVTINWDAGRREFVFTSTNGTATEFVHIVNNAQSFQVGAYEGQTIESYIGEMTGNALGINKVIVVDPRLAQKSLTYLQDAINLVSSERARIGSIMNRLEHTVKNLANQSMTANTANARIRDLDIAAESAEFAKYQIMTQAAQSMLQQANKMPQNLLQLLRG